MSASDVVLGLFIGYTETRNDYNKQHPNPMNIGIVGATPSQWGRFLKNQGIPINSLRAGVAIFKHYMRECRNNPVCAMEKYKGIQSTKMKPMAYNFIKQYNQVLALEKQRDPESFYTKKKGQR